MLCSFKLELPRVVPVMTLRETVFFPHSVMPLFIFEPRYRAMLRDVLAGPRVFALAKENEQAEAGDGLQEPMHELVTIGVVRAAHANRDGTSNLILQGITRARVLGIASEDPYRTIHIKPARSVKGAPTDRLARAQLKIQQLLASEASLCAGLADEFLRFLEDIDDPETYLDLTIHSVCHEPDVRQTLLETLNIYQRFRGFRDYLLRRIRRVTLYRHLQGDTPDDAIGWN
jgi:ATP-dependent Lon protease